MKAKFIFSIVMIVAFQSFANDKFTDAMQKAIQQLYAATDGPALQTATNSFQRIAEVEKSRWEPLYYLCLGHIFQATREQDGQRKDAALDLAADALAKAQKLEANNSELVALEGFIAMIRLTVDPAARGAQYSAMAANKFEQAIGLNPNNPRAMALLAQIQLGTAQFFHQQPVEACASAEKARLLFEQEKPASPLAPVWGKSMNDDVVKKCSAN